MEVIVSGAPNGLRTTEIRENWNGADSSPPKNLNRVLESVVVSMKEMPKLLRLKRAYRETV